MESTDGGRPHKVKWEWLFNALWAGCRRSILRLQLPETVLFTDGQPTRWLGSTDGHVQRRDFLQHARQAMRRTRGSHQMHDRLRAEFAVREQLAHIHARFGDFRRALPPSGDDDDDDDDDAAAARARSPRG